MTPSAGCPRCGYDLSGETARWREACPLEGVCSECGLGLTWAELLSERINPPAWHVEHARRGAWRRAPGMVLRTLRPDRFWSGVRMEQVRRPWRSVRFAVLGLLVVVVGLAPARYGAEWLVHALSPGSGFRVFSRLIAPQGVAGGGLCDALFSVTPLRIVAWWPMPKVFRGVFVSAPSVHSVNLVVLLPVLYLVLTPLTFVLVPATLGSARVRAWHLVRASLTGLPAALAVLELTAVSALCVYATAAVLAPAGWLAGLSWGYRAGLAWMAALVLWQWAWWLGVNRRFLRLAQPRMVTAAMLSVSSLAMLVVVLAFTEVGAVLVAPLEGSLREWWLF